MTSNARTPDDIERDIRDERAEMSGTINDLQKKFSVEAIVNDLGGMFRDQGGDLARGISGALARNPAAAVMTAAGLAWLLIGWNRSGDAMSRADRPDRRARGGSSDSSRDAWDHEAAPAARGGVASTSKVSRYRFGDEVLSQGRSPYQREDGRNGGGEAETGFRMSGAVRNGAGAAADAISDAAGSARDAVAGLADRFAHGAETFSEEGRARVMSARRTAHEARISAEAALTRGRASASDLFETHPLVVGALAVALGAAIAAALPRSRMEDEALGESSDRLYAEAESVFREERDKAAAVLRTAGEGATREFREAGSDLADELPDAKSASEAVVDRLSGATERVVDDAKSEAERQGLGERKS